MKVCFIAGGKNVPSSTFRGKEYLPYFSKKGVSLTYIEPLISRYPPANIFLRTLWLFVVLFERFIIAIYVNRFDVVILQRELVSTLFTFEWLIYKKKILDVDDAIHLKRNGLVAKLLAKNCDQIVCGNPTLGAWYEQYNSNVTIIPTGIDTSRYTQEIFQRNNQSQQSVTLGWIGTSSNFSSLYMLEPVIVELIKKYNISLKIISDVAPVLPIIPAKNIIYSKWSKSSDVVDISSFDIGLMPLLDSKWNEGKCSFKLLQYLSCSVCAVASPVGFNNNVINDTEGVLGAATNSDWVKQLSRLIESESERAIRGKEGRNYILDNYSLDNLTDKWIKVLDSI